MEDSHIACDIDDHQGKKAMLFGVFDGHGGKEVAQFAKDNFKNTLQEEGNFKSGNYERALEDAFLKLDSKVK